VTIVDLVVVIEEVFQVACSGIEWNRWIDEAVLAGGGGRAEGVGLRRVSIEYRALL
jgi:hypothetical protein